MQKHIGRVLKIFTITSSCDTLVMGLDLSLSRDILNLKYFSLWYFVLIELPEFRNWSVVRNSNKLGNIICFRLEARNGIYLLCWVP
jgi:hypothetical protein